MQKPLRIAIRLVGTFLILAWGFGGRSGFDYGLTCTKCLDSYHVAESRFLGITYKKRTTHPEPPTDYVTITGHPCEHVFHMGGFGDSTSSWLVHVSGCGTTGEGMAFTRRNRAIRRTFELHKRTGNKELARRTLALIDRWFPPDSDWKVSRRENEEETRLWIFSSALEKTATDEAWEKLLNIAGTGTLEELAQQIPLTKAQ